MTDLVSDRPTGLGLWLHAARPRTLTIAIVPVAVGAALAWADWGVFSALPAVASLVGALFIQIGTNLHNDAADGERGCDQTGRLGPMRLTGEGWATPGEVKRAAALSFIMAALAGLYIAWIGGWPILLLGVLCLVAGWCYSGGPMPIAYTPLGEVFVLLFFGLAAVGGTYWLQVGCITASALVAGALIGLPAAAVLLVNNHRDRVADGRAGRRTLAIVLGASQSVYAFAVLILAPFLLVPALMLMVPGTALWVVLGAIPMAITLIRRFAQDPVGPGLNGLLAATARYQCVCGFLLVVGLVLKT